MLVSASTNPHFFSARLEFTEQVIPEISPPQELLKARNLAKRWRIDTTLWSQAEVRGTLLFPRLSTVAIYDTTSFFFLKCSCHRQSKNCQISATIFHAGIIILQTFFGVVISGTRDSHHSKLFNVSQKHDREMKNRYYEPEGRGGCVLIPCRAPR